MSGFRECSLPPVFPFPPLTTPTLSKLDGGQVLYGEAALSQSSLLPESTVLQSKRLVGLQRRTPLYGLDLKSLYVLVFRPLYTHTPTPTF